MVGITLTPSICAQPPTEPSLPDGRRRDPFLLCSPADARPALAPEPLRNVAIVHGLNRSGHRQRATRYGFSAAKAAATASTCCSGLASAAVMLMWLATHAR